MDITKFFDRVNHDILMHRVGQTIRDKRMLGLIGRDLRAGVMIEGVVQDREEGTPQGGPLSPLLVLHFVNPLTYFSGQCTVNLAWIVPGHVPFYHAKREPIPYCPQFNRSPGTPATRRQIYVTVFSGAPRQDDPPGCRGPPQ
jgi:hypothetical protein